MASFVVMERGPAAQSGIGDAPVDFRIVRDGFALAAFLLPAIWLLWHRLWIEALLSIVVMAAISMLGNYAGFGQAAPLLSLLISVYVGVEGSALRLAALRRRGWRDWGVVEAANLDDAETRYLAEAVTDAEGRPAPAAVQPQRVAPLPQAGPAPALGLFSYPGGH